MTKYLLTANRAGKDYYYFRPSSLLQRRSIPAIRLSDDRQEAIAETAALAMLVDQASPDWRVPPLGGLLREAQRRARWEKATFSISGPQVIRILFAQNCRCALSGLPLDHEREDATTVRPFVPRLDRIDSTAGYTQQNVRIVVATVRSMIDTWGIETWRTMSQALAAPPSS